MWDDTCTHLESLGLAQDDDVEVGAGHEGEVGNAALLLSPAAPLAMVAHHRVHAVAVPEADVEVHGDVTPVVHSVLQVDGEPVTIII